MLPRPARSALAALSAVMLVSTIVGGCTPTRDRDRDEDCTRDEDCATGEVCGTDGTCTDSSNGCAGEAPCGEWCTPGDTACSGDAVVTCVSDANGKLAWGPAVACTGATPSCSGGRCAASCVDECANGDTACMGPHKLVRCGQGDSDPCLEWVAADPCGAGETCSAGACRATCVDECAAGASECFGDGLRTCGDLDKNGCREWGPVVRCTSGSCSAGRCTDACVDECSGPSCEGNVFRACGNFDGDSCLEASAGTSCASSDPCVLGSCTASGCATTARVCDTPPAPTCVDSGTKRIFDSAGSCRDGACTYGAHDVSCPNCPSCDPCAGVSCDHPPSPCYAARGTCSGGACSYAFADGASCDDGDACTGNDRCFQGSCGGDSLACDAPPASSCLDANTQRSWDSPGLCSGGSCRYTPVDTPCAGGCRNGRCACAPTSCEAQGANCGTISDGCGGTLTCGSCSGSLTCGGGGTPNHCGGWLALPTNGAPSPRYGHSAVWTGSEMIVWGGYTSGGITNTGARFNPATGSWTALPTTGAPAARYRHSAVWTGSEMIVWGGGVNGANGVVGGGRYDPVTNSWSPLDVAGAPSTRLRHTAVWAGNAMFVWGGFDGVSLMDGGRWFPATGWTSISTAGAGTARSAHASVWTGSEMLVWGGENASGRMQSGESFSPSSGRWSSFPSSGAPSARAGHSAVWTGREMIVWGGDDGSNERNGGRFDPATRTWLAISTTGAPSARRLHSAVWTGQEMLIWGGWDGSGSYGDGARFVP